MRLSRMALRLSGIMRRVGAQDLTTSSLARRRQFAHRGDIGGAATATDVLTKLTVVLLSTVNAVMWYVYTEAPFMAAFWAVIAGTFAVWMKSDAKRR